MIIRKIYELAPVNENGVAIRLRVPITIVSDESETRVLCCTMQGKYYWRKRRNYYTEAEWQYRCETLVSEEHHGKKYDSCMNGIPYCYFSFGEEGNPITMIGLSSTEVEREASKRSHEKNRAAHLVQIARNNERIREERSK